MQLLCNTRNVKYYLVVILWKKCVLTVSIKAGTLGVSFPMRSLGFFIDLILPAAP